MNTWLSLLPPIITILIAFLTREVLIALFSGLLIGVIILHGTNFTEYDQLLDNYLVNSIANADHVYILLFSLFTSGSITILHKNRGMEALLSPFISLIKTKKQALWSTYFAGFVLFFDDYANTLVIGNTMRSITDKFKISREKLAYLVDSTSAPIASIALVSTWIGAELSYISEAIEQTNTSQSAYSLFISSIPYAFYPILTLLFIAILIFTEKDFGPMKKAEESPFSVDISEENQHLEIPPFWSACIPIAFLVFGTVILLYLTGKTNETQSLSDIIGNANSYKALLWSSFFSLCSAIIISLSAYKKSLLKTVEDMIEGFTHLFPTLMILVLAWALSAIIVDLKTTQFIISALPLTFPSSILPAIIFCTAAVIAFATGTSWGTMAVLFPLALPLVYSFQGVDDAIIYASIASVLSGAVFGDHCSPISDTTILSSMASKCNHIAHVKTQLPYALTVGGVSLIILLLTPLISNPLILLLAGTFICYFIIWKWGKK